jgi:hypothetical protein
MGNDVFSQIHAAVTAQAPPSSSGDVFSQIHAQNQPPPEETGVWAGIKRNTVGVISGLYHAFTDPATDQEKAQLAQKVQDEKAWQTAHGYDPNDVPDDIGTNPNAVTLAYHRLIDAPAKVLQQKGSDERAAAQDLLKQGKTWQGANLYASGATDAALSAVPLAGPLINNIAERFERGDHSGAATDMAALVVLSKPGEFAKMTGVPDAAANLLKSSAQKNYEDVLNPTRVDTKYQTQQIMPKLLEERPVAMTRQGLANKAAGQADIAGQQIEQTVSGLQGDMKTQPVINQLENLRQKYQVNGVSLRPEVDGAINTLQDQLRAVSKPADVPGGAQGPGEASISYQDVVRARRILDDAVAEVGGYQGKPLSDTSLANIRKATANSFREELSQASPDLAAVNAKFHFWNTLEDVLDQTMSRKTGQVNALPKVETIIGAAGGFAQSGISGAAGFGAAINLIGKAVRSTAWRTLSAATKGSIADALANGQFGAVSDLLGKVGVTGQAATTGSGYRDISESLQE